MSDPIVLAFSGGLDTSYCVPWLSETYGRPVVTVTVDTGGLTRERPPTSWRRARAPWAPPSTSGSTPAAPSSTACCAT